MGDFVHLYMCKVEGIMNARPITTTRDDKSDLDALTTNYFLLSRSNLVNRSCICCYYTSFSRNVI